MMKRTSPIRRWLTMWQIVALAFLPAVAQAAQFQLTFVVPSSGNGVPNTMIIKDQTGAGLSQYPLQFGRPFLQGAIPAGFCPAITIDGVNASASQSDIKERWPDGSVKWAVMATIIPSVAPNGSVTLGFIPSVSCDNTPLSSAEMLQ